jgi:hypothetical protein
MTMGEQNPTVQQLPVRRIFLLMIHYIQINKEEKSHLGYRRFCSHRDVRTALRGIFCTTIIISKLIRYQEILLI